MLLAAAARILNAAHFPVWTDEGWSTWAASDHNLSAILSKVAGDRHPPLYFVALSAWWSVAGDSRIALRFLSIGGGLLTIAVMYRLGADVFGKAAARYGALLLAVLPSAVYFSQEIRHYGWLMLSVTAMTFFLLRYLRRPRQAYLIGYTLSTVAMLYTLYFGVLILPIHAIVGLIWWQGGRQHKRALIGAWLIAFVLYIPWLFALEQQWSILGSGIASLPNTLSGMLSAIQSVFGGQFALTIGLYVLGVLGVRGSLRRRYIAYPTSEKRYDALPPWTIILSGAGLLIVMMLANNEIGLLSARTLVFLTPALMLVCGAGLMRLAAQSRQILAAMLVIAMLAAPGTIQPRLDYQVAARALAADYTPGDTIVLETGWDDNAFRYELMLALGEQATPDIIRTLPWVDNRDPNVPVMPHIEPLLRDQRRVWVVQWLQPSQAMPFLDSGGDGFRKVLTRETSTGTQYNGQYADPVVHLALYERPQTPMDKPQFGGLFTLNALSFPPTVAPGDTLSVDLWWTVQKAPPLDYSVGVFLMDDAGYVAAHSDGPPGSVPTSEWPVNRVILDRHTLTLPPGLRPGHYTVGVAVYWYGDQKRLPLVSGNDAAIIGSVDID